MADLRQLQQQFMGHLLGKSTPVDSQIVSTPVMSARQRLSIYSSAYRLRLKEALSTDYEKLHAYLGDDQFDQLMDDFIDSHPSSTFSLRYYSIDLPDWLQQQPMYQAHPQLIELARVEKAFADSFDSETVGAIDLTALASVAEQAWPVLRLQLQPSLQILYCHSNAVAIWKALAEEGEPPAPEITDDAQPWLIWRKQDLISHYRAIDTAEVTALTKAIHGATFAEICESLLIFYSEDETPHRAIGLLQSWIQQEMVAGIETE